MTDEVPRCEPTAQRLPLRGVRVVELDALGPVPHAAMMLADAGAGVTRVVRPGGRPSGPHPLLRGRDTVELDLKSPQGAAALLDLIADADILLEGFRPGVMERLGLGPDECAARNPGLVYGRMTGWGQDGPLRDRAGHDINYIALTGALHAMGEQDRPPVPPLNLVGDYGGGSMLLLFGVLAALWQRGNDGAGQVVDAAMVDGTLALQQLVWDLKANDLWSAARQSNQLDGGAPFYRTYRCSDDRWVAVGALEPQFYRQLLDGLGLADAGLPDQFETAGWPELYATFARVFSQRTRDDWAVAFAAVDACVTPVLAYDEVAAHPHVLARAALLEVDGVLQAAPVPRFSAFGRV